MTKSLKGSIMLLITAFIWGTAFVAQSEGMNFVEPFTYNAARSFLGGAILIPIIAVFKKTDKKEASSKKEKISIAVTVKGGVACGFFLCVATSFQQFGISMTTAGKAGFITALYIIIVSLAELIIFRKSHIIIWISTFLASVGFWLLCVKESLSIGTGDVLVLCGAVFFAMHIMVIDHFNAKGADGMLMSCIQFFTGGIVMTACMLIFENPSIGRIIDAGVPILYAGILSSGVAYTLQILGQRYTEPTSASLIMSLESIFAALSGWLILGERLSAGELCGCALVFVAVILAQLKPSRNKS